jgi:hypothetical protein
MCSLFASYHYNMLKIIVEGPKVSNVDIWIFFLVLKHVQFYYGIFLLQNKLTIKFEARQCIDIKVICKVNQTQKLEKFQHISKIGMYAHLTFCNMLCVSRV